MLALVLFLVGMAAFAPGDGSAPATEFSGLIAGLPLQQAGCAQWRAGSATERSGVVGMLGRVVAGRTPYGPTATLTGVQAERLFNHVCASPIAHGFLLYELYIRAAAFRSQAAR
ncbi:MAG: hypothetical protein NVS2B6_10200 [Thermoleophilaceae bacterium]